MELKLEIGLNQIVSLIRELPYNDKLILKNQLEKELVVKYKVSDLSLRQLLLAGPVMTEDGYKNYKDNKVNYHSNTRYEEKNHIYPGYDRRFDNKDYYRKKKIEHYSRDDKRNRHKQEYYREYHNRNKNKYENNPPKLER
jgi:hypothetical protein